MFGVDAPEEILKIDPYRLAKTHSREIKFDLMSGQI